MKLEEEKTGSIIRFHERGHFQTNLRDEIVKSIESGIPRSVIVYQYGVSRSTLCDWMRNHGSSDYRAKQQGKHLSDIEKRSIVRLIEQGILTPHAARKTYGISGNVLNKWLRSSMKENVELAVNDLEMMEKDPAEEPDLPDPEKQALKKALEEAQLKINALNTLIDVAEDQFKIAIRKKPGARQS
jgi:DNA invertase Pin-like site-specific DNA recombinase